VAAYAPEAVVAFTPVTWNRGGEAIKVFKVPGTGAGTNYFDLSDWETGNGGTWENWSINNGVFTMAPGTNPMCDRLSTSDFENLEVNVYPNPVVDRIFIKSQSPINSVKVFNMLGKEIQVRLMEYNSIDASNLSSGLYILKLRSETSEQTFKFLKR
jgi:hypothetical protein